MAEQKQGFSGTFEHDSLFGWINMLRKRDSKVVRRAGERPPYPIIIDNPTTLQVFNNMNLADFGLFGTITFVTFFASRGCVKTIQGSEYMRRQIFNCAWTGGILFAGLMASMNSYQRLQGYVDNGLQWKRKEIRMKKYDFLTGFEENTIWKHLRLNENK